MNSKQSLRLTILQKRWWINPCHGESSLVQPILGNEKGVAIIAALLILMLLSLVAITFTDTTITEKAIVRSEAVFERAFYKAESGAMEGVQKLANESAVKELLPALDDATNNADLLASVPRGDREDNVAMTDTDGDSKFTLADVAGWDDSEVDTRTYRRVVLPDGGGGVGHEGSLKVTAPRDYHYSAFGYSDADNGSAMIKVGYVKHF
jgi:Tfp pilus assembly protein PilX